MKGVEEAVLSATDTSTGKINYDKLQVDIVRHLYSGLRAKPVYYIGFRN